MGLNDEPKRYTLRDIREFRPTTRSYQEYEMVFSHDLRDLPAGSRVLDIGSAKNQEFARGLKKIRPDVMIVSLDASLALPIYQRDLNALGITYHVFNREGHLQHTNAKERRLRLKNAFPNTIAAIAPDFPFTEGSFDGLFDSFGAFNYFPPDIDLLSQYIQRGMDLLKSGGKFGILPIATQHELIDIALRSATDILTKEGFNREKAREELVDTSKERMSVILESLGINTFRFMTAIYTRQDGKKEPHAGVVITK